MFVCLSLKILVLGLKVGKKTKNSQIMKCLFIFLFDKCNFQSKSKEAFLNKSYSKTNKFKKKLNTNIGIDQKLFNNFFDSLLTILVSRGDGFLS